MAGAARAGRRWIVALALAPALAAAGCGGDPEPTAEERRAAKAKWVQRADAACRKANEAIAGRGWPADLVDLDRLAVRGIEDARAAIKEIAAMRIPEGAGREPRAFVDERAALEPELDKLPAASEDLEPAPLVKAAEALKPRLAEAQKREVIDTAVKGMDTLDPPGRAADRTANYQVAPRDLRSVTQEFTALLEADKRKAAYELDRAKYLRTQKELNKAADAEIRTRRKMPRAVGASPTGRIPEQGETAEPETGRQS